jgi:hypothetical protein
MGHFDDVTKQALTYLKSFIHKFKAPNIFITKKQSEKIKEI